MSTGRFDTLTVVSRPDHHTKNYESRRIPMNEALVEALRQHKRDHIIVGSPYVFANRDGKPYRDVREPLDRAAQEAGIGDTVKLHQLRTRPMELFERPPD